MRLLEEAIENERELAEGCMENARCIENNLDLAVTPYIDNLIHDFKENAEEHEQMVTWLEELKAYRENEFADKEQLNEDEKSYAKTDCAETAALCERQRTLGIVKDIVSMCSSISSEEWAWVNNKLDELLAKGGTNYDNKI